MIFRKLTTGLGLLAISSLGAMAADMPVKAPILKAPAATTAWTGFYVNGGLGYGLWSADTTTVNPGTGACILCVNQEQGGKGWLGVIGIGYDYQFAPRYVAGVFTDFDWSSLKGTVQDQGPFFAGDIKLTYAWAAGARLGYLLTPQRLIYANAGYTNAHFASANMVTTFNGAAPGFSTSSTNAGGWFVGIGTETAAPSLFGFSLGPNWYWRSEYRYANYQNKTLTDTNGATVAANITFEPVVQTVTTQLVYKFNEGGPRYPAAPAYAPASWTGFYVNAGVGYGLWAADTTTVNPGTGACILCVNQEQGGKGWLGTVGVGYDYQFAPRYVAGLFTDFDWSGLKGTIQDQGPFFAGEITQKWAWAAGLRLGLIATPGVLGYINGGYTNARFGSTSMSTTFAGGGPTAFGTPATNFSGWFIGSGADVAMNPGWFWRTEYRYARYENKDLPDTTAAGAVAASIAFKPEVQTFTTGLVYKFGWFN